MFQFWNPEGESGDSLQGFSLQKLKSLEEWRKLLVRRNVWETHHKRLKNFCFRLGKVSLAWWRRGGSRGEGERRGGEDRTLEVSVISQCRLCTGLPRLHSQKAASQGEEHGQTAEPQERSAVCSTGTHLPRDSPPSPLRSSHSSGMGILSQALELSLVGKKESW